MVSQVSQPLTSGRIVQIVSSDQPIQDALNIPPLTHVEASILMAEEARRTLALFESLTEQDWTRPTACTRWNVHQVASHLVGESAGYASWREFYRLYVDLGAKRPYFRAGMPLIDAINQTMVDDRADRAPADLIAELREAAPKAIKTRLSLPAMLRAIPMPMPLLGTARIDYLTDMIYPRDTWMHRVDILRAAGREITLDNSHDARIIALVIRDLAPRLTPHLGSDSIALTLDTPAGGTWRIGQNPSPSVRIEIGLIAFMLLASGRTTSEDAAPHALTHGDHALGMRVLKNASVPF